MIKASKQKQKEGEMVQSKDLYGREDNKKKQPSNSSPATDTLRICDEVSS